jgi:hypothetical protein
MNPAGNPYAAQLGDRDPMQVIAATPDVLATRLAALGTRADQPIAPGKWSPRQIACHLADCEIAFGFRFRQALAEERHVIQPFDQDLWAKPYAASAGLTAAAALAAFKGLRAWNIALLRGVSPETMQKTVVHPERGDMPYRVLVETMAGHDLNHLGQLPRS